MLVICDDSICVEVIEGVFVDICFYSEGGVEDEDVIV